MWKKWVRLTSESGVIHSGFLIQALRRRGAVHHCIHCGARMFVKYASGLCPLCYNGRLQLRLHEPVHPVPDEVALAGILDDLALEWVPDEGEEALSE